MTIPIQVGRAGALVVDTTDPPRVSVTCTKNGMLEQKL